MNKFVTWLQNLTPETIIIFTLLALLLILIIYTINRVGSIKKYLVRDSLVLSEDMLVVNNINQTRVKITNSSFYNMVIHEYGFMQKNVKHSIRSERISIDERDDIVEAFTSDQVRQIFSNTKFSKIYFYVIDSSNRVRKLKMKRVNKYIKQHIKAEKKAYKKAEKQKRFDSGNYNFGERIVLILGVIVSPIVKLYNLITRKTNSGLHKRNIKKSKAKSNQPINDNLNDDNQDDNEIELDDEITFHESDNDDSIDHSNDFTDTASEETEDN